MWWFKHAPRQTTILVELNGGVVIGVVADAKTDVRVIIYDHDKASIEEHDPPRVETGWSIEALGPTRPA